VIYDPALVRCVDCPEPISSFYLSTT